MAFRSSLRRCSFRLRTQPSVQSFPASPAPPKCAPEWLTARRRLPMAGRGNRKARCCRIRVPKGLPYTATVGRNQGTSRGGDGAQHRRGEGQRPGGEESQEKEEKVAGWVHV